MLTPALRALLPVALLSLLLSSCTEDEPSGRSGDGRRAEEPSGPCAALSHADASRIVGVRYDEAKEAFGGACSYVQRAAEAPYTLITGVDRGDIDDAARVAGIGPSEVTEVELEVPGADEAAALLIDDGEVVVEQLVATADDQLYIVIFGGARETAVRLLATMLGEDAPAPEPARVADACSAPGRAAVAAALGSRVTGKPVGSERAWSRCEWESPRLGGLATATVTTARGAGSLDTYWAGHVVTVAEGVEPEDVPVPGADAARVVVDGGTSSLEIVTAAAVRGDLLHVVEVTAARGRGRGAALDLLQEAVAGG